MYFLFWTSYYLITILSTSSSYILLAANVDDFKTLIKQFVPEDMANNLVSLASQTMQGISQNDENITPDDKTEINDPETDNDTESPLELRARPDTQAQVYQHRKKINKKKYHFNLDDLVNKVKKRLQNELINMATSDKKDKHALNKIQNNNLAIKHLDNFLQSDFTKSKKLQARYDVKHSNNQMNQMKPSSNIEPLPQVDIDEIETQTDDRYKADIVIAPSTNYVFSTTKQDYKMDRQVSKARPLHKITKESIREERKIIREPIKQAKIEQPLTEDIAMLFQGIDLAKDRDSYEQYVIPQKDNDYHDQEKISPKKPAQGKQREVKNTQIRYLRDDQYREKQNPEPNGHVMYKNLRGAVQDRNRNVEPEFEKETELFPSAVEPYVETATEPFEDTQMTTEEIKRTTNAKRHTAGTFMPKRDFYKLSSPNYLGMMPVVAEKYKFDEPIPERDREPEEKAFGDPGASINGKVNLNQ